MRSALVLSSPLAAVFVVAMAASCGPSTGSLCDAKCACEGCSQVGYDICVSDYDGDQQEAEFRGCGAEYSDYLACQDATGFCRGRDFDTACGFERDTWRRCVDFRR